MESKRSSEINASGKRAPDPTPGLPNPTQKISGEDSDIHEPNCDHCTKTFDGYNYYHMGGCSVLLNKVKRLQIKLLAASIRDVAQLRKIILDVQPRMRQGVYDMIAPGVTKFIPPPFRTLVKERGPRHCS
jgi:hypothetical protein